MQILAQAIAHWTATDTPIQPQMALASRIALQGNSLRPVHDGGLACVAIVAIKTMPDVPIGTQDYDMEW